MHGGVIELKFTSKYAAYQAIVREEERDYFSDGRWRVIRPQITADFAEGAEEQRYAGYDDQDGDVVGEYSSMIGGGYFDSELAQERHGWTDEERIAVETRLLEIEKEDGDVRQLVPAVPTPPWLRYPSQEPMEIIAVAMATGDAEAALMYEQRTERREELMKDLQELIEQQAAEADLTAA